VSQLQLAWKVHLGFPPSGKPGVLEATPLMVGELLYTCNMHSEVLA
jgi:quinoprotein glucose dehydrogenase